MFFFIPLTVILADIWIYIRHIRHYGRFWRIIFLLPGLYTLICFGVTAAAAFPQFWLRALCAMLLCFLVPKLVFCVFSLIGFVLGKLLPRAKGRTIAESGSDAAIRPGTVGNDSRAFAESGSDVAITPGNVGNTSRAFAESGSDVAITPGNVRNTSRAFAESGSDVAITPGNVRNTSRAIGEEDSDVATKAINVGNTSRTFAERLCCIIALPFAVIISAAFIFASLIGPSLLRVRNVDLYFENLPPAFEKYSIVQLSDLHLGSMSKDLSFVSRVVDSVQAQKPDLIVFTGDLVNCVPSEIAPFAPVLSTLSARDGVYSVMGNHDYCEYYRYAKGSGPEDNIARLKLYHKEMGWHLLLNDHVVLRRGADSLVLAGTENGGKPPFPDVARLGDALEACDEDSFKILLTHDPSYWDRVVLPQSNVDLCLSGHTHAGQVRIGSLSMASFMYEQWGGLYIKNDRQLYVNIGLGGTLPLRLGAWPEIVVLHLHTK